MATKESSVLLGITYLTVFYSVHETRGETQTQLLIKALPELCPYSKFCTVGPADNPPKNRSPCCKSCSCDPTCLLQENCCPDYPGLNENRSRDDGSTNRRQCMAPVHLDAGQMQSRFDGLNFGISWYYTAFTCPASFTDEDTIAKCRTHWKFDDPSDMVSVSDTAGRVYKNRFCAKCNGVSWFTPWNLKLLCTIPAFTFKNVYDLDEMIDGKCTVVSVPPSPKIAMSSRCYRNTINKCNETGQWQAFDQFTLDACESSTTYTYISEVKGYNTFKNPFCYICNAPVGSKPNSLCWKHNDGDTKWMNRLTFSAIIDVKRTKPELQRDREHDDRCQSTEVFDFHLGKCRRFTCPVTMIPAYGTCINSLEDIYGLGIYLAIDVGFVHGEQEREFGDLLETSESFKDDIVESLERLVGFDGVGCDPCHRVALVYRKRPHMTLAFGYTTSTRCKPLDIINVFKNWQMRKEQTILVPWSAIQIELYVNINYEVPPSTFKTVSQSEYTLYFFSMDGTSRCLDTFLPDHFYCGHVDLSRTDYLYFLSKTGTGVLASQFSVIGLNQVGVNASEEVYRICRDEYLPKTQTLDSSAHQKIPCGHVTTLSIVFVCIFVHA